jgi:hypothetical protein
MVLDYYAAFKVFKIPVNKWTVPTAVLGGLVLITTHALPDPMTAPQPQ